jgi:hypothetical protein
VVPQAHVEPRTITLPVVDGEGIRFTRLSTDDGLSQTRVLQIVRDQPDVEEAREAIMRTMKDGTRAAEIIDRLRSFYKKGALHRNANSSM